LADELGMMISVSSNGSFVGDQDQSIETIMCS
jgi:hypothetical protein